MSRSLHTDPYPLRAARRLSAPRRRRADEPDALRRAARQGRTVTEGRAGGPLSAVDVRASPPRPGYHHPAGPADIAGMLAVFGPPASYGLRRVVLRHRSDDRRPGLLIARLQVPGVVVLYEQVRPPWILTGRLTADTARLLDRAGARVTVSAATIRIDWPGDTLRDFMLFDGLLHEVGHHLVQHGTGKRTVRVMRTADHERRADAFAAACRRAWTSDMVAR